MAKAHSKLVADEYVRLGWTLRREFQEPGDDEPYEYLLEWLREGDPMSIDFSKFTERKPDA
jgi:hypothetical protein